VSIGNIDIMQKSKKSARIITLLVNTWFIFRKIQIWKSFL